MTITFIGNGTNALYCFTNRSDCCRDSEGGVGSFLIEVQWKEMVNFQHLTSVEAEDPVATVDQLDSVSL